MVVRNQSLQQCQQQTPQKRLRVFYNLVDLTPRLHPVYRHQNGTLLTVVQKHPLNTLQRTVQAQVQV